MASLQCPGDYLVGFGQVEAVFSLETATQIDVFQMSVVAQVLGVPREVWELNNHGSILRFAHHAGEIRGYPQARFARGEFTPS